MIDKVPVQQFSARRAQLHRYAAQAVPALDPKDDLWREQLGIEMIVTRVACPLKWSRL